MTTVRIRGIYATALTQVLRETEDATVVQASEPIRDRFESSFGTDPADVGVETSDDRQGVGVSGAPDAVERVADRLASVGLDAFAWEAEATAGAVFDATVRETGNGGAFLDLGSREGFLPYSNAEEYVDRGDRLRVQVREPSPPWIDAAPVLTTALTVEGGHLRLVRAGREAGRRSTTGRRTLAELTDLLPTDPPSGWRVEWDTDAEDAGMDALDAALTGAAERAEALEAALERAPPPAEGDLPRRCWAHDATTWVWFGRDCRFALDDHRRTVVPTLPGHHRVKAGSEAASTAVDFAEAVCEPTAGSFPFDAVAAQFGPREGDSLALGHGKPDGRLIVLGEGTVTDYDPEGTVTLRRSMSPGGEYDALGVERREGDVAITKLTEGRWWYPTVYRGSDGERRGTYVNVCTPVELFPAVARYVDLHVDVVKHSDGRVRRVDDDELDEAVAAGRVAEPLAEKARSVAAAVERAL